MASIREQFRAATVNAGPISKAFTWDGITVELRPPPMSERAALARASRITIGIGAQQTIETDNAKYQALMVVASVFEPGTQAKVFGPEDVETIMKAQSGSSLDILQVDLFAFINSADDPAKKSSTTRTRSES